jgi:hypothetical protein
MGLPAMQPMIDRIETSTKDSPSLPWSSARSTRG